MRNSSIRDARCYHLISRVAHRAYFLDEDERTRLGLFEWKVFMDAADRNGWRDDR